MTPGLYLHRDSPVHALPAGVKLGGLLVLAGGLLALPGPWAFAVGAPLSLALLAAARLPVGTVLRQLRPVFAIMVVFFGAQALLAGLGWLEGLAAAGRFAVLVMLATAVTLTTRVGDMVALFERVFAVLRPLGVDPEKLALMLALTIRLVPLLVEQVREIRMAQRARGVERSVLALFVPLTVKVMGLADALTEALEARGYDPAASRRTKEDGS
ncbi:energy-coupling factor transporter transmembrane component T family protein [Azospirillum sp. ST 5-10]|uniref:energy-coupling factor transporter transmembrane component T family protein n=1 Tax=unclassified Azospirillum TaxID=2630922 RepID=UPI003F49C392